MHTPGSPAGARRGSREAREGRFQWGPAQRHDATPTGPVGTSRLLRVNEPQFLPFIQGLSYTERPDGDSPSGTLKPP
jgi:hypothetical protein